MVKGIFVILSRIAAEKLTFSHTVSYRTFRIKDNFVTKNNIQSFVLLKLTPSCWLADTLHQTLKLFGLHELSDLVDFTISSPRAKYLGVFMPILD